MADPLDARPRDRYLALVAAELRLSDEVGREVVEELAAHIADAMTDLIAEGLTPDQAEREALARLGSPEALAQDIGRAHRTTRRMLAAAGGGLVAAGGGAFRGWFIGIFAILGAFYLIAIAGWLLNRLVHVQLNIDMADRGWNSAITGLAAWVAVWGATQAGIAAVARMNRRPVDSVRPILAGLGVVVGVLGIATWRTELNWASVLAILALPLIALVAASRVREAAPMPGRRMTRRSFGVAALVVVIPVVIMLAVGGAVGTELTSTGREWSSLEAMWHDTGWDRVGLPVSGDEPILTDEQILTDGGLMSMDFARPVSLAGWRDLRLETWQAQAVSSDIGPRPERLLEVVPVNEANGRLTASARIDDLPRVTSVYGVLTGIAPAGGRYVLAQEFTLTSFRGTVLDWFAAISR
jgi:hypothetical protein